MAAPAPPRHSGALDSPPEKLELFGSGLFKLWTFVMAHASLLTVLRWFFCVQIEGSGGAAAGAHPSQADVRAGMLCTQLHRCSLRSPGTAHT